MKAFMTHFATLLASVLLVAGCASPSHFNDPDDQRDRRDQAMEELEKETR